MATSENIYAYTRTEIAQQYQSWLEGPTDAYFLVLCSRALGQEARQALSKSVQALGWKLGPTYACIDSAELSMADVYKIIEGLDPVCLIILGGEAQAKIGEAYKSEIPPQGRFRLFGREACSFADLDAMLEKDTGKQTAWGLLRSLPHAPQ